MCGRACVQIGARLTAEKPPPTAQPKDASVLRRCSAARRKARGSVDLVQIAATLCDLSVDKLQLTTDLSICAGYSCR